jgi:hypothetical protein
VVRAAYPIKPPSVALEKSHDHGEFHGAAHQ